MHQLIRLFGNLLLWKTIVKKKLSSAAFINVYTPLFGLLPRLSG